MSAVDLVKEVLGRVLPFRLGNVELGADLEALALDDAGVSLPLRLALHDERGIMYEAREQVLPMIERAHVDEPPERLRAYLEGWARAVPELVERARAAHGDEAMPHECICPLVLEEGGSASTPDEFARMLQDGAMLARWAERIEGPSPYRLDEETYAAFLAAEQPESPDDAETRRVRAIEDALAAFPAVSAQVRAVFGLELPRTVMVFDAFWRSLSAAEREAYEDLRLPTPAGLLEYFPPGGLERRVNEGLDARLHWRWRCDPPELVTVLLGHGGDGQHYGLFYDDPARLPSGVVINYARDSAETWWKSPTLLDLIRDELEYLEEETLTEEYRGDVARAACQVRLVGEAVNAFVDVEVEAMEADAPGLAMRYEDRVSLPQVVCGVGPWVPGATGPIPYLQERRGEPPPFFSRDLPRTRRFVAEARAALDRGEPAYALALGRDLHWADQEELRADTLDLLVRAYRMLGREALAGIAEIHHRHRDLPWVAVFEGS
jgi:hypothetical protein